MRFTSTRIRARAASRCIQSTVTLPRREACHQFVRDYAQRRLAHDVAHAVVLGKRVIEGDLLVAQPGFLAACPCGPDVLGQLEANLDGEEVTLALYDFLPDAP